MSSPASFPFSDDTTPAGRVEYLRPNTIQRLYRFQREMTDLGTESLTKYFQALDSDTTASKISGLDEILPLFAPNHPLPASLSSVTEAETNYAALKASYMKQADYSRDSMLILMQIISDYHTVDAASRISFAQVMVPERSGVSNQLQTDQMTAKLAAGRALDVIKLKIEREGDANEKHALQFDAYLLGHAAFLFDKATGWKIGILNSTEPKLKAGVAATAPESRVSVLTDRGTRLQSVIAAFNNAASQYITRMTVTSTTPAAGLESTVGRDQHSGRIYDAGSLASGSEGLFPAQQFDPRRAGKAD